MSDTTEAILLAVLVLATSIWVGGYVTIAVVARAATATLDGASRVAFFRSLGRLHLRVSAPALVVALIAGGVLARDADKDGVYVALLVVVLALVAGLAVAVAQARRMTRLRQHLLDSPADPELQAQVTRGGRSAGLLRAMLGLLSIAAVVLGAFLAT